MNEEAIVLARSVLNNYFLISYILDDPQKEHIKEYHIQPLITSLFYWKNVKDIIHRSFWQQIQDAGKPLPFTE